MSMIGVLGGMGPAATLDFLDKLVKLTPASRDQEHLPFIVANLPHTHDRSSAILGVGRDPLPQLLAGIALLNQIAVQVIVIPCNSSHHWFDEMSRLSRAPLLHIAKTCLDAIPVSSETRVAVFATRGALMSGFYQRELVAHGLGFIPPDFEHTQPQVDLCIREVKAGHLEAAGQFMTQACRLATQQGANTLIMGCTELPLASRYADTSGLVLIDSSLELARASVTFALERGWNRPGWDY